MVEIWQFGSSVFSPETIANDIDVALVTNDADGKKALLEELRSTSHDVLVEDALLYGKSISNVHHKYHVVVISRKELQTTPIGASILAGRNITTGFYN